MLRLSELFCGTLEDKTVVHSADNRDLACEVSGGHFKGSTGAIRYFELDSVVLVSWGRRISCDNKRPEPLL